MIRKKLNPCTFFDDSTLSLERKDLFNKPNYLGHRLMIPDHGAYFELKHPNKNKVMINDHGKIRVLSNVCRHRNAKMLNDKGTVNTIVCPVHRWTYDLGGHLIGAPKFEDLPKTCLPAEIPVDWNGLLFSHLTKSDSKKLDNFPFCSYFSFANYSFHSIETHLCNYNWKTFIEVYLDDYHVKPFHPGLGNFVDCKKLEWFFSDFFSVQAVGISGLKKKGTNIYNNWQDQIVNFHRNHSLEWGAIWMLIYPNIMLEWYPQTIVVSTVYPLDPQRTLNVTEFYYSEEIISFNKEYIRFQKEAYRETAQEDDDIGERMDKGKRSFEFDNKCNPNFLHPTLEKGIPEFYKYLKTNSSTNLREKYFEPIS